MSPRTPGKPCLFVLDTNVLMHDPASLFRFHEHDIYLPMAVLEELDAAKKGASEVARNARQASRTLDSILEAAKGAGIDAGVPIPDESQDNPRGRIYFQTSNVSGALPEALPGQQAGQCHPGTRHPAYRHLGRLRRHRCIERHQPSDQSPRARYSGRRLSE